MSHPPLRESGAAVYAKTGGSGEAAGRKLQSVGTEDRRKVSPRIPSPAGLVPAASQPLPRRKLNLKFQQLPGLQMLLTWGLLLGAGGALELSPGGGGAGDHLEPKLPGYPAESWRYLLGLARGINTVFGHLVTVQTGLGHLSSFKRKINSHF